MAGKTVTVYLPEPYVDALYAKADEDNTSMSHVIRALMEASLKIEVPKEITIEGRTYILRPETPLPAPTVEPKTEAKSKEHAKAS